MTKLQRNAELTVAEMHAPVFQVAGIGLALIDFQGRFLRVNPALEELFEMTEAEMLGRSLCDYCPPNHAHTCFDMIQELSLTDEIVQGLELKLDIRRGRLLWVHVTASLLNASGSSPSCIVLTVHDSSDYFELQEE